MNFRRYTRRPQLYAEYQTWHAALKLSLHRIEEVVAKGEAELGIGQASEIVPSLAPSWSVCSPVSWQA